MTNTPIFLAISKVKSDEPSLHTIIVSVISANLVIIVAMFFSSLNAGIPTIIFNFQPFD